MCTIVFAYQPKMHLRLSRTDISLIIKYCQKYRLILLILHKNKNTVQEYLSSSHEITQPLAVLGSLSDIGTSFSFTGGRSLGFSLFLSSPGN